MADYTALKEKAQQVRDEVQIGANTAVRVGNVMLETVNALEEEAAQIGQILADVDALQAPASPLFIEDNRIKLRYGTGLSTQEGTLFVTGAGEGGEGSYSEGNGISINSANVISVVDDGDKGIMITNEGVAIRLATDVDGEDVSGLQFQERDGALQIKVGSGLQVKANGLSIPLASEYGYNISGLEINSSGEVQADPIRLATLLADGASIDGSYGSMSVNYNNVASKLAGEYLTATNGQLRIDDSFVEDVANLETAVAKKQNKLAAYTETKRNNAVVAAEISVSQESHASSVKVAPGGVTLNGIVTVGEIENLEEEINGKLDKLVSYSEVVDEYGIATSAAIFVNGDTSSARMDIKPSETSTILGSPNANQYALQTITPASVAILVQNGADNFNNIFADQGQIALIHQGANISEIYLNDSGVSIPDCTVRIGGIANVEAAITSKADASDVTNLQGTVTSHTSQLDSHNAEIGELQTALGDKMDAFNWGSTIYKEASGTVDVKIDNITISSNEGTLQVNYGSGLTTLDNQLVVSDYNHIINQIGQIGAIQNSIKAHTTTIDAHGTAINGLQTSLENKANASDVTNLQHTVGAHDTQLNSINGTLAAKQDKLATYTETTSDGITHATIASAYGKIHTSLEVGDNVIGILVEDKNAAAFSNIYATPSEVCLMFLGNSGLAPMITLDASGISLVDKVSMGSIDNVEAEINSKIEATDIADIVDDVDVVVGVQYEAGEGIRLSNGYINARCASPIAIDDYGYIGLRYGSGLRADADGIGISLASEYGYNISGLEINSSGEVQADPIRLATLLADGASIDGSYGSMSVNYNNVASKLAGEHLTATNGQLRIDDYFVEAVINLETAVANKADATEVTALQAETSALRTEVDADGTAIQMIQDEIEDLPSIRDDIEAMNTTLGKKADSSTVNSLSSTVSSHTTSISNLQISLENKANASDVTNLQHAVGAHDTQLNSINGTLANKQDKLTAYTETKRNNAVVVAEISVSQESHASSVRIAPGGVTLNGNVSIVSASGTTTDIVSEVNSKVEATNVADIEDDADVVVGIQYEAGNGIRISDGQINVRPAGSLAIDGNGALKVNPSNTASVISGASVDGAITSGAGLAIMSDGGLGLKLGTGLHINEEGVLYVAL